MKRNIPESYILYETTYGNEIPCEQYFVILFDELPSKYVNSNIHYDPTILDHIKSLGFEEESCIYTNNKRYDLS